VWRTTRRRSRLLPLPDALEEGVDAAALIADVLEQRLAGSGQHNAFVQPTEQRAADLLSELGHVLADAGLRHVRGFRSLREAATLGRSDERREQARDPASAHLATAPSWLHPFGWAANLALAKHGV
jgi:hypothetical protein